MLPLPVGIHFCLSEPQALDGAQVTAWEPDPGEIASAAEGPGDLLAGTWQLSNTLFKPCHEQDPSGSAWANIGPLGAFVPAQLSHTQGKPSLKRSREKPHPRFSGRGARWPVKGRKCAECLPASCSCQGAALAGRASRRRRRRQC